MTGDIKREVLQCDVCQRCKGEHNPYPGLLQPLPIPQQSWSHISLDFIEGLPKSEGKDVIMVVVDRFTKYGHFITLAHPFTAKKVAQLFLDNISRLHGLPQSMVSDRDKIFTSSFWQELFKLLGTKLHLSTAYHPQSDGQTERLNQCLEMYLRCMTHSKPKAWAKWIPLAEWWYNTTYHTAIQRTPFEALYGILPPQLALGPYQQTNLAAVEDWLQERYMMNKQLKECLIQASARMKHYADKKRAERQFLVGDWVYLKLHPYQQQTVVRRENQKLSPKYYGPYKVEERIGEVAYRLALPAGTKIHPTFHVSLLKKKVGNKAVIVTELPAVTSTQFEDKHPLKIIQARVFKKGDRAGVQWLVQWDNQLEEEATWEDSEEIQQQHPSFKPWGQGLDKGEGCHVEGERGLEGQSAGEVLKSGGWKWGNKRSRQQGWEELLHEVKDFCSRHDIDIPDLDSNIGCGSKKITVEHYYHFDVFNRAIDYQLIVLDTRFNDISVRLLKLSVALDPKNSFESFNANDINKVAVKFYHEDFERQEKNVLLTELKYYREDMVHDPQFEVPTLSKLCEMLLKHKGLRIT
ncbi:RNA-directed DNA polymerase [Abeliophyllum distichum]|uniref:RNA-directed DNA polymerase n=1 Tax=Abeliophyllum distichum TaxID=126358 RepID=A0ABD1SU22_9LAMI